MAALVDEAKQISLQSQTPERETEKQSDKTEKQIDKIDKIDKHIDKEIDTQLDNDTESDIPGTAETSDIHQSEAKEDSSVSQISAEV